MEQQQQQLASVDWQSLKPVSAAKAQKLESRGTSAFTVSVQLRLFAFSTLRVYHQASRSDLGGRELETLFSRSSACLHLISQGPPV